jgi:hypothetical protein
MELCFEDGRWTELIPGSCQVANVDVSSVKPHEFYQMLYSNWNSLGPVFSNPKIHVSEMFYLLQKTERQEGVSFQLHRPCSVRHVGYMIRNRYF